MTVVGALASAALLLAACGGSSNSSSSSTSSTTGGGVTVPTSSASGTTVKVTVTDKKGVDGPMAMVVAPASAPAGDVTFTVTNKGTIEHELVVLKLGTGETWNQLPITYAGDPPAKVSSGADKISESGNVGETGDPNLQPGQTRSFTIKNMAAGRYALVCNIAKHYGDGMRAPFIVK
jgi:uncharacterized cupredoxin-like copper-binding protein